MRMCPKTSCWSPATRCSMQQQLSCKTALHKCSVPVHSCMSGSAYSYSFLTSACVQPDPRLLAHQCQSHCHRRQWLNDLRELLTQAHD